jgi:hypothetical protein
VNEDSKTGSVSAIILAMKVSVMIFCTALSWGTRVDCMTTTCNSKVSHLNIITTVLPEIKNPRLSFPLENAFRKKMHMHRLLGLKRLP